MAFLTVFLTYHSKGLYENWRRLPKQGLIPKRLDTSCWDRETRHWRSSSNSSSKTGDSSHARFGGQGSYLEPLLSSQRCSSNRGKEKPIYSKAEKSIISYRWYKQFYDEMNNCRLKNVDDWWNYIFSISWKKIDFWTISSSLASWFLHLHQFFISDFMNHILAFPGPHNRGRSFSDDQYCVWPNCDK